MNVRRILADFVIFSRGYFRNSAALFFSLFFPIILIVMFGFIFSNSGTQSITLHTVNLDHHSNTSVAFLAALNASGAINVDVISLEPGQNLSDWLGANSDPVGLVIPAGFDAAYRNHTTIPITVYGNPQDAASYGIAVGAVGGVANAFNLKAANGSEIVTVSTSNVGSPIYKYVDYLVPGLIGFAILTSPMFSMVEISSTYRKEGLFRQLSLTPLTKAEWLTAKVLWYILLSMASAAIMITIGYLLFNAHFLLTPALLPFLIVGPFFFVGLGMLSGSLAKTPESAAIIGNVITFPMMFLSGTFFPVSSFPAGLQLIAHVLPLYYIIDGMNQVMLFGNAGRAVFDLVIILVLGIIVFIAAIYAFKWREA